MRGGEWGRDGVPSPARCGGIVGGEGGSAVPGEGPAWVGSGWWVGGTRRDRAWRRAHVTLRQSLWMTRTDLGYSSNGPSHCARDLSWPPVTRPGRPGCRSVSRVTVALTQSLLPITSDCSSSPRPGLSESPGPGRGPPQPDSGSGWLHLSSKGRSSRSIPQQTAPLQAAAAAAEPRAAPRQSERVTVAFASSYRDYPP